MLSSCLYLFSTKEFPHQRTESCSHERCHDKEPELFDGLPAFHQSRSDASCRVHGCARNRDTHNVNQYQCKSDGQFGQERLPHSIRCKAVGACSRQSSMCTGRYQQRENQRTDNGTHNLKQHVHQRPFRFHASRQPYTQCNGRIDVAAGNVSMQFQTAVEYQRFAD